MNAMDDAVQPGRRDMRAHGLDYAMTGLAEPPRGDLARLVRFLRDNLLLIAAMVVLSVAIAHVVVSRLPKSYAARATIVLDYVDTRIDPASGDIVTTPLSPMQVETEMDVARSRGFARSVVDRLDLGQDAYLNPFLADDDPATPSAEEQLEAVVTRLLQNYQMSRRGESLALDIVATHADRDQAAHIANAVADIYIERKLEERREDVSRSLVYLQERVQELAAALAESESSVAAFIRDNELDRSGYSEQLRTEIERARSLLALAGDGAAAAPPEGQQEPARSPEAQALAQEQAADLATEAVALETQLRERTRNELTLVNMQRALDAETLRYQAFVERRNSLETQVDIIAPGVRQITTAEPPLAPYRPDRRLGLAAGLVLGLVAGLLVAFLRDMSASRVTEPGEAEIAAGMPMLAGIPVLRRRKTDGPRGLVRHLSDNSRTPYHEALRVLLTGILNRVDSAAPTPGSSAPAPIIAVTSAQSGDGKSTLALSLGIVAAQEHQRVLLIDFDLQRQGLAALAGAKPSEQIPEIVLRNPADLTRHVARNFVAPGVDLLTFRRGALVPRNIRTLPQYVESFQTLRQAYDLVILDTPPLLAADEASRLAALADVAVLVARWRRTTGHALRGAATILMASKANVAGCVLNGVDPARDRSMAGQGYYAYSGGA